MAALVWWHHFTLSQMQIKCIIRQRWLYNVHERQENASDFWQYFCICICIFFAFVFQAGRDLYLHLHFGHAEFIVRMRRENS